jgi:hypothetical protein
MSGASVRHCGQDSRAAAFVKAIWSLLHPLLFGGDPPRIYRYLTTPARVMVSSDGTRFITVQVAAVTRKCDEVSHLCNRSLQSRLALAGHSPIYHLAAM